MSLKESMVGAPAVEPQAVTPADVRPRVRLSAGSATPVLAPTAVERTSPVQRQVVFEARDVSVNYGEKRAIEAVTMEIYRNYATALIGPSGCGKSTFLRCMNRMNDSINGFKLGGELLYYGHDLYDAHANRVEVRRRIGMVFQKPNPFAKSIY